MGYTTSGEDTTKVQINLEPQVIYKTKYVFQFTPRLRKLTGFVIGLVVSAACTWGASLLAPYDQWLGMLIWLATVAFFSLMISAMYLISYAESY